MKLISLGQFWKMVGLSEKFFLYRIYPLIRFIVVSGSKGKILDAPALAGLNMFFVGWCTCYRTGLSGRNWYNVQNGAESEIDVMKAEFEKNKRWITVKTGTPVTEVSSPYVENSEDKKKSKTSGSKSSKNPLRRVSWGKNSEFQQSFDSVVLASDPHEVGKYLQDAPRWLSLCTTEEISV